MNKKVLLLALCAFFYQIVFIPAFAVKAYPYPIKISQPDGTKLTIFFRGDENHHYRTTEDGYLVKANSKGFFTYATVNSAGKIVESNFIAKDALKRTDSEIQFLKTVNTASAIQRLKSSSSKSKALISSSAPSKVFPRINSPKSLVILVNFSDTSFVTPTPKTAFTNLLNQDGYNDNGGTGSARDYFMASSYGKFSPSFDVVGPYTLPNTMSFYGANDSNGNDSNPVQMIVDACTLAVNDGVDFSQYDVDNDGIIDNIFVYYAGYNEAEDLSVNSVNANTIWPHRSGVYPQSLYPSDYNYSGTVASITFNGKLLNHYACTSELKGYTGTNMCGVGTFCHEFGHVLGLPDYYNTTSPTDNTLNEWSIMDAGNYLNGGRTPPTYSVYDRFFLSWLTPEQESNPANLTLLPILQDKIQPESTANQAFLFSAPTHNLSGENPTPSEFFMVEYRKKTGWDTFLPAEGMCVWHIDYNQAAWDGNYVNYYSGFSQTAASHMRVYLQPLSGNTTTPGTAFTSGSFIPTTWSGTDINRALTNIAKSADNITFRLMPPKMSTAGSFTSFSTLFGTPSSSQNVTVTALNLIDNLNFTFQNNQNFEGKLSTDNSWNKTVSIAPVSGSVNAIINVRYNPISTGTLTDQLNISGQDLTTSTFNLTGSSVIGPQSPVIFAGIVDNSILFYPVKASSTNSKTVNIKTTDIVSDLSLVITGNDTSMFTLSTSSITKELANGTDGTNITINYIPTVAGSHNATLTISGGGLPDKVIEITGSAF